MAEVSIGLEEIKRMIPHRYPFLFVDRVIELSDDNKKIAGIKNVSIGEPFFAGHFPEQAVMPGVLQVEAMAQLAGIAASKVTGDPDKIGLLTAVKDARFRQVVIPGDQLRLEAEIIKIRRSFVEAQCSAKVGDTVVSQANLKFILVPRQEAIQGNENNGQ